MCSFLGIDLAGGEQVPGATTLCRFRSHMEEAGLGEAMLSSLNGVLGQAGIIMRGNPVAAATFAETPSPAKNRFRDPEARLTKKGSVWHLDRETHAGVGTGSWLAHTVEAGHSFLVFKRQFGFVRIANALFSLFALATSPSSARPGDP